MTKNITKLLDEDNDFYEEPENRRVKPKKGKSESDSERKRLEVQRRKAKQQSTQWGNQDD